MAYNPVNLSQLTNNWTYVDPALTGGDTNKSFINTIAYSGSNLCFGGSFIFNYDNYPYTFPFYFPQNQFQYINIAYFDPGTLRFTSLKGIGTRVAVLSTGQAIDEADSVYAITLCGSNLVAAGRFNSVNTQITGFKADLLINRSLFYSLSNTSPFNANMPKNTVVQYNDWVKLLDTIPTLTLATNSFSPVFSGNPAKNIAFYNNITNRWSAFADSASIINNSNGYLTSLGVLNHPDNTNNKVLYTAGNVLSGTILFYNNTRWDFVRPSLSSSRIPNCKTLSLVNDNRGNLVICGTFSGVNSDPNLTGIARFNGLTANSIFSYGTGITGTSAFVSSAVISGNNIIASGIFPDKIVYFDTVKGGNWVRLFPDTTQSIYISSNFKFNSLNLNENNDLLVCGDFWSINDNTDLITVAKLSPSTNYTFESLGNTPYGTNIQDYGNTYGRVVFNNTLATYTVGTTLSADFSPNVQLRTNYESLQPGTGIRIVGLSPYQGVSGTIVV